MPQLVILLFWPRLPLRIGLATELSMIRVVTSRSPLQHRRHSLSVCLGRPFTSVLAPIRGHVANTSRHHKQNGCPQIPSFKFTVGSSVHLIDVWLSLVVGVFGREFLRVCRLQKKAKKLTAPMPSSAASRIPTGDHSTAEKSKRCREGTKNDCCRIRTCANEDDGLNVAP